MATYVMYVTAGGNKALRIRDPSASFSIFFQLFLIDSLHYRPRLFLFTAAAGWLVGWLAVLSFPRIDLSYQHSEQKVGIPRDAI